jgi:polyisoprenoid-binding protein YceI
MKKIFAISMIAALFVGQVNAQVKSKSKKAPAAAVTETKYSLDKEATIIKWAGKKVGGAHNGKIKAMDGSLSMTGENINAGKVVIDMNSITCDDIKEAGDNGYLIGHLKNEDFFNVAANPQAVLDITKATKSGKGKYKVFGNLTIKGIAQPTAFDAILTSNNGKLTGKCKISFDRTKYDIKYGSGLIGTAQDKLIYDDVALDIDFVMNKN